MSTVDVETLRTIAEAAKRVVLSEPALRERTRRGDIEAVKFAGRVFLHESVVAQLAKQFPLK